MDSDDAAASGLVDQLGLPLVPVGFDTSDPPSLVSQPIPSHLKGMTAGYMYLGSEQNVTAVEAWLSRCDKIGISVLMDVRFDTMLVNQPPWSAEQISGALKLLETKVKQYQHHRCIYAWYIAGKFL